MLYLALANNEISKIENFVLAWLKFFELFIVSQVFEVLAQRFGYPSRIILVYFMVLEVEVNL